MLHYVDLSPTAPQPFNSELLVSIAKFIEVGDINYQLIFNFFFQYKFTDLHSYIT